MTGPIRPSLEYVITLITSMKTALPDSISHIAYWKTTDSDYTTLTKHFDVVHPLDEPSDEFIYKTVTKRTQQQLELNGQIDHWTLSMYKMYYGIRQLVNLSTISDNDPVIRVRTDICFLDNTERNIPIVVDRIIPNTFYYTPMPACGECDWFAVSSFDVYKKSYYIPNDIRYNQLIHESYNSETVLLNNGKYNGVDICRFIHPSIRMAICRGYDNGIKNLHFYY